MLGFIAENDRDGLTSVISWRDIPRYAEKNAFFLDVRTPEEFKLGSLPGAVNIPHTALRNRLSKVPKDKTIVINCGMGLRGYLAERILRQNGYTDVVNLSGGYITYKTVQDELLWLNDPQKAARAAGASEAGTDTNGGSAASGNAGGAGSASASQPESGQTVFVNACGLQCPGPIMQLKKEIERLPSGGVLEIQASDPGFARDVQSWCGLTGNQLLESTREKGVITARIRKGSAEKQETVDKETKDSATIIVFSHDMDKVLAAFVLANGALATGKKVTMFFTFWGLSVLRKPEVTGVKKDTVGKMFCSMLPKGMNRLSLSNMNFGGMGAKMMKGRMKEKNVDQLETMFQHALDAGVRLIACQMSMDIMGISAEELMDGVELGGVATYMEAASQSGINLFI